MKCSSDKCAYCKRFIKAIPIGIFQGVLRNVVPLPTHTPCWPHSIMLVGSWSWAACELCGAEKPAAQPLLAESEINSPKVTALTDGWCGFALMLSSLSTEQKLNWYWACWNQTLDTFPVLMFSAYQKVMTPGYWEIQAGICSLTSNVFFLPPFCYCLHNKPRAEYTETSSSCASTQATSLLVVITH